MTKLDQAAVQAPTTSEIQRDIFASMTVACLLRNDLETEPSHYIQSIEALKKYATTQLKFSKTKWPKVLQDQIEKKLKDCCLLI